MASKKFRFIYLGKGQNYEVENSDKFEVSFGKNSQGKTIIREINWIKSKGGVEFKQSDITPGDQILGKGIIISTKIFLKIQRWISLIVDNVHQLPSRIRSTTGKEVAIRH